MTGKKPEDLSGQNPKGSFTKPLPSVLIGLGLMAAGASGSALAQAQNDTYSTPANTALSGNNVADNDLWANTFTTVLTALPSHGTVTLDPAGTFVYTPAAGYSGPDQFTYMLEDPSAGNSYATVDITVIAPPAPPAPAAVPALGPASTGLLSASLALLAMRLRRRKKDE
ncbi:Ig-like domain-containing protein [Ottowia thiooxydans]|uniref:Cadherin-like domain-containing protein n=1 Tax=Ottowia thiooxydans TaxID=219182 RepID=A0ABV2QAN8_9BURK